MQSSLRLRWGAARCIAVALLFAGCSQNSLVKPPEDAVALHQEGDERLSCRQLDSNIQQLYRQARQLAPKDFSADRSNSAAAAVGTLAFTPAYLHILKNELLDKPKQRMRIEAIAARVELLRDYKAQRHCYESR